VHWAEEDIYNDAEIGAEICGVMHKRNVFLDPVHNLSYLFTFSLTIVRYSQSNETGIVANPCPGRAFQPEMHELSSPSPSPSASFIITYWRNWERWLICPKSISTKPTF
jgi:hypothetical protein